MELSLLLIIIGIVLAIFVWWGLGVLVVIIGLAMLIIPRLNAGRGRV